MILNIGVGDKAEPAPQKVKLDELSAFDRRQNISPNRQLFFVCTFCRVNIMQLLLQFPKQMKFFKLPLFKRVSSTLQAFLKYSLPRMLLTLALCAVYFVLHLDAFLHEIDSYFDILYHK